MAIFTELERHVGRLRVLLGVDADDVAGVVNGLCDDDVAAVIAGAGALARAAEGVGIVASGVAARRSRREAGHDGLAQKRGHRNTVSLVQELTGSTRADAQKHVRLGESLLDAAGPIGGDGDPAGGAGQTEPAEPWHAALSRALLAGAISSTQHDAILRGLGEPPTVDPDAVECSCPAPGGDPDDPPCGCAAAIDAATVQAWSLAAEQLIDEARHRTVEELRVAARAVRDRLDPEGAERRYLARFEARAFRMWTDADGVRRGAFELVKLCV